MTDDLERKHYESPDLWSDERFTAEVHRRIEETIRWIPEDACTVLDVGCGNGLLVERLRSNRFAVGVDRSHYTLRQFLALRCQADADSLPFADGTFDCVVCAEVIEHLPLAAYRVVLQELARVARRYIIITVPFCEDLLAGHVVCPACWCRFNANYHLRSFYEVTLQTLYDGYPQIRLKRLAGLIPDRIRRLGRLWTMFLLLRYDLLGAPDLAPHMQCPHCGYRNVSDSDMPQLTTAPRLGIAGLVERLWPKQDGYRWWIALYEKTGS